MDTRLIPAGTAVLRCGTTPRYHLAEGCWDDLEVPSGASKLRQVGLEVAHNLNRAVERMTGDWLATIDDDHLLELINDRIRKLPGVRRTETFMYLKLKKQTYNWGIA